MSKAKPIEKDPFKAAEEYSRERDEVIESKDPARFIEFVKKHKREYEPQVYAELTFKFKIYGDDYAMLIMANMSECCTRIKPETKKWYENWRNEWRKKHGKS